jgi:hypothetical protein
MRGLCSFIIYLDTIMRKVITDAWYVEAVTENFNLLMVDPCTMSLPKRVVTQKNGMMA